jgi:hypothetical protein
MRWIWCHIGKPASKVLCPGDMVRVPAIAESFMAARALNETHIQVARDKKQQCVNRT